MNRLLIFTRVPEFGKAKTRLIPALGPERAAQVHADLTRMALSHAATFQTTRPSRVEVWYSGENLASLRELSSRHDMTFRPQVGSDLGERLIHATTTAFVEQARKIVVIGTDCPALDETILQQAFHALDRAEVVLGPATDGGYYLIGLRASRPELFQEIDWGSDQVLGQTLRKCQAVQLSVAQLSPLSDVDFPEDLIHCRAFAEVYFPSLPRIQPGLLSIIIPTLNEEQHLESYLRPLLEHPNVEIIVADGGSSDQTCRIARELGATVIAASRGRGRQMNAGAALARGESLLFLHADTRLPDDFREQIDGTLGQGAIAGAFRLRIEGPGVGLRWVEWGANLRSWLLQRPYGDQGLFVKAVDFFRIQGYPNWPLMEDVEICRRLRKLGPMRLAQGSATTSGRRWRKNGVIRTTLTNQFFLWAYRCGVSPETLARWYYRKPKPK